MSVKNFIEPKSIVIVGASRDVDSVGGVLVKNLKKSGVKLFLINPFAKKIQGIKCYPSVLDFNKKVDLAIIATPGKLVPRIIKELGDIRVHNAIIISSGFSEEGNIELEKELISTAKSSGVRFIGPNCLGVITPSINMSFYEGDIPFGNISMISQSGALGVGVLDYMKSIGVGVNCFISLGNMKDIDFSDFFVHFNNDVHSKVLSFYMEGLNQGFRFVKSRIFYKKPVIVLKSARTPVSGKTALSHTGSLSKDYSVFKGVFKQHNIFLAEDLDDFLSSSIAASEQVIPLNKKVFIVTNAGGLGVLSVDKVVEEGLELYSSPNLNNPLDLLGDANNDSYKDAFKKLRRLKGVGAFLVILTPQAMSEPLKVSREIVLFSEKVNVPVYASFFGGKSVSTAISYLVQNNIPVFFEPMQAIQTIKDLSP